MKINPNSFFDGKPVEYDLDRLYESYSLQSYPKNNNPEFIQRFLGNFYAKDYYQKNLGFGGYGENRKNVWKGTYLDEKRNYIHLGVDINALSNTIVKSPINGNIVDVLRDTDTEIGWGGRLIIKPINSSFDGYLVLAHLDPDNLISKGKVSVGDIIGYIGTYPKNGNTFEHLHIQCIKHDRFQDFDGYGFIDDLKENPNPFEVEF